MRRIQTSFIIGHERLAEGQIEEKIIEDIGNKIIDDVEIEYTNLEDASLSLVTANLFVLQGFEYDYQQSYIRFLEEKIKRLKKGEDL